MNGKAKRVAIYARVSTLKDQDPQLQVDELRQVAEQRGWTVVGTFVDRGVSGSKDRRPQLDLLMDKVHRGGVDVVAVWKFDRFARSVRHLVMALDEFRARRVDFFSSRDAIDTSTPAGRFVFAVIAAVAELERELIRERTRAGLQAARRRGARLGRPRARFDLDKAVELRGAGQSYEAIATLLRVSVGTIHGAISRLQKTSPKAARGKA